MKKISLAFIILTMALSLGGVGQAQEVSQVEAISATVTQAATTTPENPEDLQRIPSPDQIKYFQDIKRFGTVLMGKLKEFKSQGQDKLKREMPTNAHGNNPNSQKPDQVNGTSTLEKISHPNEIKNFEKIRKIGESLFGIRRGSAQKPPVFVTTEAAACVVTAIDKKDTAVKYIITTRSEKVIAAIDARNACQKAAITKATAKEQGEANRTCAVTFQATTLEINKAMEQAKKERWQTFNLELKSCSALQPSTVAGDAVITLEDGGGATE